MKDGVVRIHNRDYKTVALRVNEFREIHGLDLSIETEIVESNENLVIMKSQIRDKEGFVIGTGFAEEKRNATQINRTSALENCETSAIGRALAACGFGGTEYASANEVQNAIQQQMAPDPVDMEKVNKAITFFKKVIDKDQIEQGAPLIQDKWELLTNDERLKVQEGLKEKSPDCNKMYSTLLKEYQAFVPPVPE